jgi:hypothetical protein
LTQSQASGLTESAPDEREWPKQLESGDLHRRHRPARVSLEIAGGEDDVDTEQTSQVCAGHRGRCDQDAARHAKRRRRDQGDRWRNAPLVGQVEYVAPPPPERPVADR